MPDATNNQPRKSGRREGLETLGLGSLGALLAFGIVRLQWTSGAATVLIPGATILSAVCVAIGLFQLLTGRERSRGLGIAGILFAALFGFVGAMAGFMFATPRAHHEYVAPSEDDVARKMAQDINVQIQSSIVTPAK